MGKFTFKDRQERGEDFLRFLETENISIDGMGREQVADLYNKRYKMYLHQIIPGQAIPSFSSVLQPLFVNGILHLQDNVCYFGPHSSIVDSVTGGVNGGGDDVTGPAGLSDSFPKRPGYRKFAVDQHKILKKLERVGNETSTPDDSTQTPSADSLPQFISLKENVLVCKLCSALCTSEKEVSKHVDGRRHRVSILMHKLKSER